jgi:hypothetical protein
MRFWFIAVKVLKVEADIGSGGSSAGGRGSPPWRGRDGFPHKVRRLASAYYSSEE